MALTASINLNVTPLPDNDVWFANAQAWTNYWKNTVAQANFDPAVTSAYVAVPWNTALTPVTFNMPDNVNLLLVTVDMYNNMKARLDALNQAFSDLKAQMKAAGFISTV